MVTQNPNPAQNHGQTQKGIWTCNLVTPQQIQETNIVCPLVGEYFSGAKPDLFTDVSKLMLDPEMNYFKKLEPKMKNNCRWTTYWGGEHMKAKQLEYYLRKSKIEERWQTRINMELDWVEVVMLLPEKSIAEWWLSGFSHRRKNEFPILELSGNGHTHDKMVP